MHMFYSSVRASIGAVSVDHDPQGAKMTRNVSENSAIRLCGGHKSHSIVVATNLNQRSAQHKDGRKPRNHSASLG